MFRISESGRSTTEHGVHALRLFPTPADLIGPNESENDIIQDTHSGRRDFQTLMALGNDYAKGRPVVDRYDGIWVIVAYKLLTPINATVMMIYAERVHEDHLV